MSIWNLNTPTDQTTEPKVQNALVVDKEETESSQQADQIHGALKAPDKDQHKYESSLQVFLLHTWPDHETERSNEP